eukprot:TRINITY_DN11590_c0_g2_i1.p1 TRINITY_DN11590_c0_g2~~TRINITY_DN11590_c0_g2_i1.p1  ORF type:complete len:416 (+),score=104.50 TRINITY_DN11590_c0_g2_i1:415-1662(+)
MAQMTNMMGGPMAMASVEPLKRIKPDVLAVVFAYPILYAVGEMLGLKVVGIGWGTPSFLTGHIDAPWSLEPNAGSMWTRRQIYEDPMKMMANFVVRLFTFFTLRISSMINAFYRFRIGHWAPFELFQYDIVLQHPLVLPTLPEFTAGMPSAVSPFTFFVGILDHPGLGGASIAKSDDAEKIMAWLDEQHRNGQKVLYVAFGSEVKVQDTMADFMARSFKELTEFGILWASKRTPNVTLPPNVYMTKFSPQRAVLNHPAVVGFMSHGGGNSVAESLMFGKPLAIMPFFGDQMIVAASQVEAGVGTVIRKDCEDTAELVGAIRLIATDIKDLNAKRKDLSRAVEVIVNHGSNKFVLQVPRAPNVLLRLLPLWLTMLMLALCCNACGCFRIGLQPPCCFRRAKTEVKPATAGKKQKKH